MITPLCISVPLNLLRTAVTHAAIENWEYMEIIRQAADPKCAQHLEKSIQIIDHLLSVPFLNRRVKALFGVADLEHDEDFVSLIEVSAVWSPTLMYGILKHASFTVSSRLMAGKELGSSRR